MTETATLITQLRVLAQLTRTEAQVARLRVTQANTDDVRDDLRQNAADADARAVPHRRRPATTSVPCPTPSRR